MHYTVRNPAGISTHGLAYFPFARHYSENLGWFIFLALLRCFSSGGFPHIPIWFSIWCMITSHTDCSIRKSADWRLLTATRSLSQLTTSFIGSQCQGIRPALFIAWPLYFHWVLFWMSFVIYENLLLFSKIVVLLPDWHFLFAFEIINIFVVI